MSSFIPRLVIHKDEIDQIFFPETRSLRVLRESIDARSGDSYDPTMSVLGTTKIVQNSFSSDIASSASSFNSVDISKDPFAVTCTKQNIFHNGNGKVGNNSSNDVNNNKVSSDKVFNAANSDVNHLNVIQDKFETAVCNSDPDISDTIFHLVYHVPGTILQLATKSLRVRRSTDLADPTTIQAESLADNKELSTVEQEPQQHDAEKHTFEIHETQTATSQHTADCSHDNQSRNSANGRWAYTSSSNLTDTILHLAAEVPGAIFQIVAEVPETLANISTLLPVNIAQIANDVPVTIVQISSGVAREVVQLPHRASHNWRELIWVMILLILGTLTVTGVIFFIPLSPVNEGLSSNRDFLYGYMTYYELLALLPWIETCNFAMPQAKITVKARVITLFIALSVQKLLDAILAEGWWWHKHDLFPIPFSIILSGIIAFLCVIPLLKWMTPTGSTAPFFCLFSLLSIYWFSLLVVGAWAVGMRRLMGRTILQNFVGSLYGPIRFFCKIIFAAPLTTKISPRRWVMLNMVVDILFTRVQIATYPYIDSYITVILLFTTEVLTLAWRYYGGIDRLALWWTAISSSENFALLRNMKKRMPNLTKQEPELQRSTNDSSCMDGHERYNEKDRECNPAEIDSYNASTSVIYEEFGQTIIGITTGCFRAPIPHIAQLNFQVLYDNQVQKPQATSSGTNFHPDDIVGEDRRTTSPCGLDNNFDPTYRVSAGVRVEDEEGGHLSISCMNNDARQSMAGCTGIARLPEHGLSEEHWEQRPLYHVIDSVGSTVVSIIVRTNQQLILSMVRVLPGVSHLNETFEVNNVRWKYAQLYGWLLIVLMLLLLASLEAIFFKRFQRLEERELTLSRIMSYIYRDHFWFFFLWLVASGAYACATMINHFGADFTLQFYWIMCPTGQIDWPGCLV